MGNCIAAFNSNACESVYLHNNIDYMVKILCRNDCKLRNFVVKFKTRSVVQYDF